MNPQNNFRLTSIITEGNEYNKDVKHKTTTISYDQLNIGRNFFKETLYIEDENKGRFKCNNATFKFIYHIDITRV